MSELSFASVQSAAAVLEPVVHRTPVLRSTRLDALVGAQVYFKCENLQRVGAFKFRGAYHALAQFSPTMRAAGVVAFSSGNHAQGIALAAKLLDISATIVVPHDAPAGKVAATRGYGARVVTYDRGTGDREQIAADLAAESGATVIPSFDHPWIIAGQGTAAMELFVDVGEFDALWVPLGGGGLTAGSVLAAQQGSPGCVICPVEPEAGNDGQQSLLAGQVVRIDAPVTIADGAQTTHLGAYTYPIISAAVPQIYTATDAQLIDAMKLVASTMKLVIEPTAALGLAGLLTQRERWRGARVGVLLSGGNIDLDYFAALIGR